VKNCIGIILTLAIMIIGIYLAFTGQKGLAQTTNGNE
jgi:hypothetical protein